MKRWFLVIVWSALSALMSPVGARGQGVVLGQVVDEDDLRPVAGAIVSLMDAAGRRIQSTLTDDSGAFTLPLASHAFQVRAEMIGRQSVDLSFDRAGPRSRITIRLPTEPIVLDGIDVSVGKRCSMDPSTAEGTYLVWQEVQKALRAASLTAIEARYRFRVAGYERKRERRSKRITEEIVYLTDVSGYDAFRSLAPEHVHDSGYVAVRGETHWIYGPSTAVLLSREFEADHCFALRRDEERGRIGLTFEPVDGRRVPEIEGVLWVGETTGELHTLEFEFKNVPAGFMPGDYRGFASFRRLEASRWSIDRWWLRSPDRDNLYGIREEAGEILQVTRIR